MAARTLEQLNDILDSEFAWRRKELTEIRSRIPVSQQPSQAMLLRAGVALLYAHWEGFVKHASNTFIEYVRKQRHQYDELGLGLLALCVRRRLHGLAESNNPETHIETLHFLLNELGGRARIPLEGVIRTKSNLNSQRFKRIVVFLGLDYKPYEPQEKLIDHQLVKWRNQIAHGEYRNPRRDEFDGLYPHVVDMMARFKNDISNSAATQRYLLRTARSRPSSA